MSNNMTKYTGNPCTRRDEFVTSFDHIFNDIFHSVFPATSQELGMDLISKGAYPKVNVLDEDTQVVIVAEVPGLNREQITVDVNKYDKTLTIKGERRDENQQAGNKKFIYRELKHSSFARSFQLHENLNVDQITAKFENGVLELKIPKKVPDSTLKTTLQIPIE